MCVLNRRKLVNIALYYWQQRTVCAMLNYFSGLLQTGNRIIIKPYTKIIEFIVKHYLNIKRACWLWLFLNVQSSFEEEFGMK